VKATFFEWECLIYIRFIANKTIIFVHFVPFSTPNYINELFKEFPYDNFDFKHYGSF